MLNYLLQSDPMGGPCNYCVIPSPNWTFEFGTALKLGLGLGLGRLDFGLGLDNIQINVYSLHEINVESEVLYEF